MDDPSPVGASLLPPEDLLVVDSASFASTSSSSARAGLQAYLADRIMVGRTGSVEAWSILRFVSIPDTLAGLAVETAELELKSLYVFGNEAAPLSFRVRKIAAPWTADSVTYDSIMVAGFLDPLPVGEASSSVFGDSGTVIAPLDTAMVNEWLRAAASTDISVYGIALEPTNNGVIYGFGRFADLQENVRPLLRITYLRSDTARIDTVILRSGTDRFVTSMADTSWASSADRMYVRSGVGYRGVVEFSLAGLPPYPAIHKATLQVVLDATASEFNRFTVDSLQAVYMSESGFQDYTSRLNEPPVQVGGRMHYRFIVTDIVRAWLRGSTARKLGIAAANEVSSFEVFALYGVGAFDPALRPTLTILYSKTQ